MDLFINEIKFKNFRNYKNYSLDNIKPLTIIVGNNAVGKTNIVEGIQIITTTSSFRNASIQELLHWNADNASISAEYGSNSRSLSLRMSIHEGKKLFSLNGKRKKPKEVRGILPAVTFFPDDLVLIKGSYSVKRDEIDSIGIQLNANYHTIKKDYEKILMHKNTLLKKECSLDMLHSINETLKTVGVQLYCYRSSLFQKIAPLMKKRYYSITQGKEELSFSYTPSWVEHNEVESDIFTGDKERAYKQFSSSLTSRFTDEIIRKRSLIGPHADKIEFYINGKNARTYGSQGQQRLLVLSLKLAELEVIKETLNQQPILLLDDVMSELDSVRRAMLLDYVVDNIQTFITTTNLEYFTKDILQQAGIIRLEKE